MTQLQSGAFLGRYELLVRIGRGGMASVWVARERAPKSGRQRLVAVKAMLPELAQQTTFRSMFLEEGQLVRSIEHPNVVAVHDVSEAEGILYMAMEWVEGESLRNVIRAAASRRPIPSEIAVQVVSDAARGLHAAHELRGWDGELRGIVHCDVSPHNILLGVDGRAKLVDFGVASALGELEGQGIKGKPAYMSPEQARGETVDRRTDVFALGVVLFELTTGQPFMAIKDRAAALAQAAAPRIQRPSSLIPNYPPALEAIVLQALAPDPRQRFQTAEQLRLALDQYLVAERIVVSPAGITRLLRKVVGDRVEKRRELLSNVLRDIDGDLSEELVAVHPGLASPAFWEGPSEALSSTYHSLSETGVGPVSLTSSSLGMGFSGGSLTEAADYGSDPGRAAPRTASSKGSNGVLWALVVFLLLALAGTAAWTLRERLFPKQDLDLLAQRAAQTGDEAPGNSAARPSTGATAATPHSGASGIDLEALPVLKDDGTAARPGPSRPAGGTPAQPGTHNGPAPVVVTLTPDEPKQPGTPPQDVEPGNAPEAPAGPVFNRTKAGAALAVASAKAAGCGSADGPFGRGVATVTFSTNGKVSYVTLPFKFRGNSVGDCVAEKFREASVPAFDGADENVSQSFVVNAP